MIDWNKPSANQFSWREMFLLLLAHPHVPIVCFSGAEDLLFCLSASDKSFTEGVVCFLLLKFLPPKKLQEVPQKISNKETTKTTLQGLFLVFSKHLIAVMLKYS